MGSTGIGDHVGAPLIVEPSAWSQLEQAEDGPARGRVFLVGAAGTGRVAGAARVDAADDPRGWSEALEEVGSMVPVGLTCLGACYFGTTEEANAASELDVVARCVPKTLDEFYVLFKREGPVGAEARRLDPQTRRFSDAPLKVRVADDEVESETGYLRIQLEQDLDLVYDEKSRRGEALDRALEAAAETIEHGDFEFLRRPRGGQGQPRFFSSSLSDLPGDDAAGTLADPVLLELYARSGGAGERSAPILRYEPTSDTGFESESVSLQLDVLASVPRGARFDEGSRAAVLARLLSQLKRSKGEILARPSERVFRYLHFHPPPLGHTVTLLYPDASPEAEDAMASRRRGLHALLLLPLDRPLLRISNALSFGGPGRFPGKLLSVHESLGGSGVEGGRRSMVSGPYCYFHYMQDRFDDAGWGCAYRSLQTIVSWFVLNDYTRASVPGHREIQETLVGLGDKPSTFVGSKQWIGAIEISFILDSLLGVSSKVLTFNSGEEIPTRAREIARHFETQGTPVMIGGGVLAYTLLGIDYNDQTGECAFLILDPHYTEDEDLGKIGAGAWCGWKRLGDQAAAGGDLFVKTAFYNFLCPQRPSTV